MMMDRIQKKKQNLSTSGTPRPPPALLTDGHEARLRETRQMLAKLEEKRRNAVKSGAVSACVFACEYSVCVCMFVRACVCAFMCAQSLAPMYAMVLHSRGPPIWVTAWALVGLGPGVEVPACRTWVHAAASAPPKRLHIAVSTEVTARRGC
jgi:hypothetical protein